MIRRTTSALTVIAALALIAGCSGTAPAPAPTETSSAAPVTSAPPTGGPDAEIRDIVAELPGASWQEALAAAQSEFDGKVTEVKLDRLAAGGWKYQIELVSADTKYEVQYDADTLEKFTDERESLGDDAEKAQMKTFDPEAVVPLADAANTARGQQEGTIVEWSLEADDTGRTIYEFEILPPGSSDDVEVKVDASDGTLIGVS